MRLASPKWAGASQPGAERKLQLPSAAQTAVQPGLGRRCAMDATAQGESVIGLLEREGDTVLCPRRDHNPKEEDSEAQRALATSG